MVNGLDPPDSENATIDYVASRELESRKAYGLSQGKASELDGADPIGCASCKRESYAYISRGQEACQGCSLYER